MIYIYMFVCIIFSSITSQEEEWNSIYDPTHCINLRGGMPPLAYVFQAQLLRAGMAQQDT